MSQLNNFIKKKPVIIAIIVALLLLAALFIVNSSDDSAKLVGTWASQDGDWVLTFNKNGSFYDSEAIFTGSWTDVGSWEVVADGKLHIWSQYDSGTFDYKISGKTLTIDRGDTWFFRGGIFEALYAISVRQARGLPIRGPFNP